MRKNYTYMALSCAALLAFGSCVEENFEQITPAQVGDEIVFGVRAGFEDSAPETRTEYGGKESEYVYGGKTYERINWVAGDMVEIYSPDAANNSQSFHYTVTKPTSDPQPGTNKPTVYEHLKDYASLTRYGDAGIQWGSAETHHFYAMYPSSVMWTGNADPEVTVASGAYMDYDNGSPIVHGIIPITQNPTKPVYESTTGNWVVPADMRYAYMVARGEATKEDASVELTFVPIVTAVEMELKLDEAGSNESVDAVNIAYVQVIGRGIAGDFTADLSDWPANGYPKCTNSDNGTDVITIDVRGAEQQTKTIQAGGSLTFTVFLRPGANVEDLNVSFFDGTRFLGKDLKGANIPMNLKTRIVDIRLPKNVSTLPIHSDKWMDRISGDVEMKALSLPGTGNSFSYGYTGSGSDRKYFATQERTMTIDAQWNLGIRAFEIVSDRPAHKSDNSEDLGTMDVECNKEGVSFTVNGQTKKSVKDALLAIAAKVRPSGTTENDWSETAVVILTYQPHEGRVRSRNSKYYAYALKNLYDSIEDVYSGIFELYEPDLTLDEARGHILLLCRINQRHEGETDTADTDNGYQNQTSVSWANDNFETASTYLNSNDVKVVLINGCGTGKDKWGCRGYTVGTENTPVLDIDSKVSNVFEAEGRTYSYVEQYMGSQNWNNRVNFPAVDVTGDTNPGGADFTYGTNHSDQFKCWIQEWARVSVGGGNRGNDTYFRQGNSGVYWYNSYDEKLGNAAYTFKKAINDMSASLIYVNWLGGYLIDAGESGGYTIYSTANRTWGGDGGDVQGLANKLNPDFMEIVENSGWENKTGPTGIVMIDYVGATPGAEKLPGTILMNNFRHDAAAGGGIIVTPPDGSGDGFDNGIEE